MQHATTICTTSLVLHGPDPQAVRVPARDRLLAVLGRRRWGLNFPAIAVGAAAVPTLLPHRLRFALIAVPTLLLVPRPAVAGRWLLGYGSGFGVLQFLFLYLAMDTGHAPGPGLPGPAVVGPVTCCWPGCCCVSS
jgi:O-acetylserine/cysteine efflux transporter